MLSINAPDGELTESVVLALAEDLADELSAAGVQGEVSVTELGNTLLRRKL